MREFFQLDPSITFLNHGSFGALPKPVSAAQQALRDEIERNPVEFLGRRSAELLYAARLRLAQFVGAKVSDLVFVDNATVGVNVIANSLDLQPGDEVLGTSHEYGACEATWQVQCALRGAHYRTVDVALPFQPAAMLDAVKAAITPNTRVLFLSHITSPTALVFPLAELIALAHQHGVLVLVDGAHGPAFLDLDLTALNADFYTGNCHKWLCAPRGAGFLHVRADHHDKIRSPIISWGYVGAKPGALGTFTGDSPLERKLQWLGTRDITAPLSVPAAIDFMESHAWATLRAKCRRDAQRVATALARLMGTESIAPEQSEAQMVAVALPSCPAETLRHILFTEYAIEMPITSQGTLVLARISVQVYNSEKDFEHLLAAFPDAFEKAMTASRAHH